MAHHKKPNILFIMGRRYRLVQLVAATHTGMSSEEFNRIASGWIASARHPNFKRPFPEMVYQPMLEVLAYLRANALNGRPRLQVALPRVN